MKNKINYIYFAVLVVTFVLVYTIYNLNSQKKLEAKTTTVAEIDTKVDIDNSDEEIEWTDYEERKITLSKSITIDEDGIYYLSGTISNGLITIKTDGDVNLVLDNVQITNNNGPAIYVENANSVLITTKDGSVNTLTDGNNYISYDIEVEGTIYSKDDLILGGTGTLIVNGNKGDAIVGKDDLKINNGFYEITSNDDAIRGKDSVYIIDGNFTINANGDGIKSTNDTEEEKGYVKIDGGNFDIISTLDGIQAETKVLINGGIFDIKTGGGSSNSSDKDDWGYWRGNSATSTESAKGIKAVSNIVVKGGTYNLDTSDDAIHSNNFVGISNGVYNISSGDDGIHADKEVVIDGGTINVEKSYEGLEAETITINDGTINLISSDDGINVAGGNDGSANNRPGNPNSSSLSSSILTINGGNIDVNATGDGLDANGTIYINGGKVTINGPTSNMNGILDYDLECIVKGGTLIGIGSSGMAQGISNSSTQYGIIINFSNSYSSGQKITIENSTGKEIMSYTSKKSFSSVVFSSIALSKGTYTVKVDETTYDTFKINSISTMVGNGGFIMGGPPGRR